MVGEGGFMGHRLDRGDIIDMLEESAIRKITVVVELANRTFEDRVKEIVKWEGEDHVVFEQHELTPLSAIRHTRRATPPVHSYAGKR
jgi:hypothetical protein